jgi:hypothetical protein
MIAITASASDHWNGYGSGVNVDKEEVDGRVATVLRRLVADL